mmetsp:Transcript_28650/g.51204  ORF Transcript_28650/g.51204 Transcript_28650/m.51204 type:complete len:572 (-) Transcript_28650:957-2672(-)
MNAAAWVGLLGRAHRRSSSSPLPLVLRRDHDLLVLLGRVLPAHVLLHPALLQRAEGLAMVFERHERVIARRLEGLRLRAVERPAGARVLVRIVRLHCVAQPAHRVHQRHGAVRHGVQLVEAARLKARRHQQNVDAGGDAVRHRHVEPHPRLAIGVARLHTAKVVFEVVPSRAQHDHLHVLSHQPIVRVPDEVDALLVVQPPNEAEQWYVRVHLQTELLLQRRLAGGLAGGERLLGELFVAVCGERFVGGGVPLVEVDAVDDAPKLPAHVAQVHVQPPPALLRLALPRVPVADGHQAVRGLDARLQDVHVLAADGVVQVEAVLHVLRDLKVGELVEGGAALVGHVVEDEDSARKGHLFVVAVVPLQVDGQQGGVPVVGDEAQVVVAVGDAAAGDVPGRLEGSLAQQRAAEAEVEARAVRVDVFAGVVVHGVVDEDVVDAVLVLVVVAHLVVGVEDAEAHQHARVGGALVVLVARGDGHRTVTAVRESLWQRAHDIAQSSCFGPRSHLRAHHHHLHHVFARQRELLRGAHPRGLLHIRLHLCRPSRGRGSRKLQALGRRPHRCSARRLRLWLR